MNENIGDILLETKRCSMLQEDNIIEWDITAQSLDLFFIWCVEDISRQRSIQDDNEDISGYDTHTDIRLYFHY